VHALLPPLTAALVAFAVALAATPAVRFAAARSGMVDVPGPRSSHARATPRGGGLAVAAALGAAVLLQAPAPWGHDPAVSALLLGAAVAALLGLADDRFSLSAPWRLAVQSALATAFVVVAGGFERLPLPGPLQIPTGALGGAAAVVWIVAVMNFYNFLDGIDGLAALQGAVTGLGIALAGWDPFASLLGAALAGGCAAFLVFNWSPARIFLGDAGSLLLGFSFAALPLLAPPAARPRAVFFVAMSLWLFLSDATFTLLRRFARGARWDEAHREHLYQRLVKAGATHRAVALAIGGGSLLLTAVALGGWRAGAALEAAAALVALALFAAEWAAVRAREARVGAA
jgi:UDP-N-acetylmuramyl pentapeptide phosphotransferase/UDP-N-acetylglucosamine-1-phosphate transferase